jgi:hypothetical protein
MTMDAMTMKQQNHKIHRPQKERKSVSESCVGMDRNLEIENSGGFEEGGFGRKWGNKSPTAF